MVAAPSGSRAVAKIRYEQTQAAEKDDRAPRYRKKHSATYNPTSTVAAPVSDPSDVGKVQRSYDTSRERWKKKNYGSKSTTRNVAHGS